MIFCLKEVQSSILLKSITGIHLLMFFNEIDIFHIKDIFSHGYCKCLYRATHIILSEHIHVFEDIYRTIIDSSLDIYEPILFSDKILGHLKISLMPQKALAMIEPVFEEIHSRQTQEAKMFFPLRQC